MAKVSVEICMGTTCFVMGGNNLQELQEVIPERYGKDVAISGIPCMDLCSTEGEYSKAPYVKVNGNIVREATVDKVLAEIDKILGAN